MLSWLKKLFGRRADAEADNRGEAPLPRIAEERQAEPTMVLKDEERSPPCHKPTGLQLRDVKAAQAPIAAPDLPASGVRTAMATHIGTRTYQQDALYVSGSHDTPGGYAYGVLCDGMGGMENGGRASALVMDLMARRLAALPMDAEIPGFYESALAEANEMVRTVCAGENGHGSGTTLVSVVMREGGMYWAAVGDSRIYIIRKGDMVQVTRDHNYAMQLQGQVDEGRLTQSEADNSPMREALISYIGAPALEIMDISRGAFPLMRGDIALLCSDGLTKSLSDSRILEILTGNACDLDAAARALPYAAVEEGVGSKDNTSVVLLQYIG